MKEPPTFLAGGSREGGLVRVRPGPVEGKEYENVGKEGTS